MSKKATTTGARSKPESLAGSLIRFFRELNLTARLPKDIVVMNPYREPATMKLVETFCTKYYSDNKSRVLMLGINPGRFGSGTTGISFTDPIRLETACGIQNILPKKPELSSDFIYRMMEAYGGPDKFYARYFISAVSPLGFTQHGKNINYYDDKKLEAAIRPFAADCITRLVNMGMDRSRCYCVGEGKNVDFLRKLNTEFRWFDDIIPLAHPRFIMQYRRKQLNAYIDKYLEALR